MDLAGVRARELADQPLGVAVAVDQRGVDEVDAVVEGALEGRPRVGVAPAAPHAAADGPGAVAVLGDFRSVLARLAIAHGSRDKSSSKVCQ